ncbi:MAG: amidohydrolase family protein [Burkholderiaceae bacterium]
MSGRSDTHLFLNAALFLPDGTRATGLALLTRGARIERIAAQSEFDGYQGPSTDASGATILPGLIDCHVHLVLGGEGNPGRAMEDLGPGELVLRALEHAQRTLRAGVTAVRDCGGRDYLEFAVRDACNRNRLPGPTIRAAGRMICMTGGHGNRYGRVADGVDDVVRAVREQIHAGSDFVKIMATGGVMTPGVDPRDAHYSLAEISAGIAEATRFRRSTASHAQGTEGILNATRAGVTSIEHGIYLDQACIEEMLARGTTLVPTLSAVTNIVRNDQAGIPAWALEKAQSVIEVHRESVRAFARAGGVIAMGTDAGTPFNLHGENPQELALMTEVGMSPSAVLLAATRHGADLMRLPDHGRLADGARADLLIVDGDPTTDIRYAAERRHHRQVFRNGMPVETAAG